MKGYARRDLAVWYGTCGCRGASRQGPVQLADGSWGKVCWWGPASHPEDARLHLPHGQTVAGAAEVEQAITQAAPTAEGTAK